MHFTHDGHAYFYSGHEEAHKDDKVDWLEARNYCREYCMDLVSVETPSENDMVEQFILGEDLPYIWTSGRLCNFHGCELREDLKPVHVNGWFWSGSGVKMAPTNDTPPGWPYQVITQRLQTYMSDQQLILFLFSRGPSLATRPTWRATTCRSRITPSSTSTSPSRPAWASSTTSTR